MTGPPRISAPRLAALAQSLSPTERAVVDSLGRVRLATGNQLQRLHFADRPSAARQTRRCLNRLMEQRLLSRLDRQIGGVRAGSSGHVYGLDVAGQRLVNATTASHPRRPWTPGHSFLAHSLAVTEIYVQLVEAERTQPIDLLEFVAEPVCWRSFAGLGGGRMVLKPDAYLCVGVGPYEDRWFVEVDRSTEAPATLSRKASVYVRYWQSGREQAQNGVFPKVLWIVPDDHRCELLTAVLAALPPETWQLFQVVPSGVALRVLSGGEL